MKRPSAHVRNAALSMILIPPNARSADMIIIAGNKAPQESASPGTDGTPITILYGINNIKAAVKAKRLPFFITPKM